MMPSPPIDDSYDTCHPRWLAAGRCGATKLAAVTWIGPYWRRKSRRAT
jgi:hypothetical protein